MENMEENQVELWKDMENIEESQVEICNKMEKYGTKASRIVKRFGK